MPNTESPIIQNPAGHATAQQPDTDRRARRRTCLRRTSLGICVMLIAQLILGVCRQPLRPRPGCRPGARARRRPRPCAHQPARGPGRPRRPRHATARRCCQRAGSCPPARHKLAIAASATGLAAIVGAAASGASFVSDSRAGASMAMAVLTGVALLCYLGNLFAVPPRPTAAAPGGRDD
jgi:hypothetical protein